MKRILAMLLVCLSCIALPGCQARQPAQTPAPAPAQKVTVLLDWFPNTNHTGLYVALARGYYAAEGLDVQIIQPPEGGNPQLVAAGRGDFAVSAQEEVTMARSQDIPVVATAAVIQHNTSGFASPADRNIKNPADFAGKTYGGWGTPAETAILKALMGQSGADYNKLNIINIGSADFFTSIQKDIDFSWIFWGWTGIESSLKKVDLNFIRISQVDPRLDYYTPVIITSEAHLSQQPELVRSFMKATTRGYQDAIADPEACAQILLQQVPDLNRELVAASQHYLTAEYQAEAPRWGEMKESVWKNYTDFLTENGLVSNVDPARAFTNDFLPEPGTK